MLGSREASRAMKVQPMHTGLWPSLCNCVFFHHLADPKRSVLKGAHSAQGRQRGAGPEPPPHSLKAAGNHQPQETDLLATPVLMVSVSNTLRLPKLECHLLPVRILTEHILCLKIVPLS